MYSEEKQKKQAIEIAMNPLKAFDYGRDNNWVMDKKNAESIGFSKGTVYYHKVQMKHCLFQHKDIITEMKVRME